MADPIASFTVAQAQPVETQIADHLRACIADRSLPPGARLPPTSALARQWGVPVPRIQAALRPLVREGLLLRRQRVGTVVREAPPAITCVGLYRREIPGPTSHERSAVRLEELVAARLAAQGITNRRFHETRPDRERWTMMPELRQAVRTRAIDGFIACESDMIVNHHLAGLPFPVVGNNIPGPYGAGRYDFLQFAQTGAARLAARGCRSAGLIAVVPPLAADSDKEARSAYRLPELFRSACAEHGLATAGRWERLPAVRPVPEAEAERYGFDSVQSLWNGADRPDGLLVFTDLAARGAIMGLLAVLDDGVPPPALVLHRNRELGLFCPLPADFLEASLEQVATALVDHLLGQRQGQAVRPPPLPFTLVAGG